MEEKLHYLKSHDQVAYIFTKALIVGAFKLIKDMPHMIDEK